MRIRFTLLSGNESNPWRVKKPNNLEQSNCDQVYYLWSNVINPIVSYCYNMCYMCGVEI